MAKKSDKRRRGTLRSMTHDRRPAPRPAPDYEDDKLVLVPSNTMSEMLDDMCDLGMAIDDLLDIFYTLMDGGDISSDDLMERLIYAEDASEEAYARWGDPVRCMSE